MSERKEAETRALGSLLDSYVKGEEDRGENIEVESVLKQINERDLRDQNRSVAPLKPASNAFTIDSTGKTPEDILKLILDLALQKNITVSNL